MAEDAKMYNCLTMDISHQLHHPMASTLASDAANCYDCTIHTIMLFLLLAVTGWAGAIVTVLYPIQVRKFFQHTGRGDSIMIMGGPGRLIQGVLPLGYAKEMKPLLLAGLCLQQSWRTNTSRRDLVQRFYCVGQPC